MADKSEPLWTAAERNYTLRFIGVGGVPSLASEQILKADRTVARLIEAGERLHQRCPCGMYGKPCEDRQLLDSLR